MSPRLSIALGSAALLVLAACAKEPPPASVAEAERAIRMAEDQGAGKLAPLELRVAQDRLAAAKGAEEAKDADRLAAQAMVNAELAQAKADAARAQAALADTERAGRAPAAATPAQPAPRAPAPAPPPAGGTIPIPR